MAIEVHELKGSRTGGDTGRTFAYAVTGTDSDLIAKANVESESPSTYDGLARKDVVLEKQTRAERFVFRVAYGDADGGGKETPKSPGESSFRFDTTGGTDHITQSLNTRFSAASAGNAPDMNQAIGVVPGVGVEGCDITVPKFSWSDTLCVSSVSAAYIDKLYRLTGKTNDDVYTNAGGNTFEAGEVLFLGAQGAVRTSDTNWELQFHHAAIPNQFGLQIADWAIVNKKGWEYLWVMYEDDEDEDTLIKVPRFVYIEQVYESGDFYDIGL